MTPEAYEKTDVSGEIFVYSAVEKPSLESDQSYLENILIVNFLKIN